MKALSALRFLVFGFILFCALALPTRAATYNWNTNNGTWDTTTANWSGAGSTWVNANDAVFNNSVGTARTITLNGTLTANSVLFGTTDASANFGNYTLTGGPLSVSTTLVVQGSSANSPDAVFVTINSDTNVTGSTLIGRANLSITGGNYTTSRFTGNPTSSAWDTLTISGSNTVVTATNGIDPVYGTNGSNGAPSAYFKTNLDGGTLYTSVIKSVYNVGGGVLTGTLYNGTVVKATGSNAAFVTGTGTANFLSNGGAIFDSNGFDIGIGTALADTNSQNAGTLTKQGNGTLTLSAANTYTGATKVTGGMLSLGNATALQNSALDTANSITGDATNGLKTTVTSLTLGGLTGNKNLASLFTTTSGNYSTVTALTLNPTYGTVSYSGNITNGASGMSLTKTGNGTQVLSGTNTYNGTTTLTAGTLSVATIGNGGTAGGLGQATNAATNIVFNGGALQYTGANATSDRAFTINAGTTATINTANNISFAGATGTATNGALTKTGNGILALLGANTYTGATKISAGTLDIGGGTSTGSLASTTLNLAGGTLAYTRTGNTTQSFTTTTISGPSAVSVVSGDILNLGTITRSAGGYIDFGSAGAGTVAADTASNVGGIISGATFGSGWAVANGAGVAITALGTYTATSTAGTTAANYAGANIDVDSSAGTLGGVITPNSLRFNTTGANTVSLATGNNDIASGGILVTSNVGANLSTITGGTLRGPASGDLAIYQNNTAGDLNIASTIANNTATSVSKNGAGTLVLSGNNTFTGNLTLNSGTLKASGGGVASLGGSGTIILNGGTLQLAESTATNPNHNAVNVAGDATIISDKSSSSAGVRYLFNGLTIGNNTLTVSKGANSTTTLGFTEQQGTLVNENAIQFQNTAFTAGSSPTFNVTDNAVLTALNIPALGAGTTMTKQGNGVFILYGSSAANAGAVFNVNAGTAYFFASTGMLGSSAKINVSSGARITIGQANSTNLNTVSTANGASGIVAGSFLRYDAAQTAGNNGPGTIFGTVELNANNVNPNYTLNFGDGGKLTTLGAYTYTSPITLSGNASIDSSTGASTYSTGGITASTPGAKTLTLTGNNTGANTISSTIADGSGTVTVQKTGSGNWTLSGTNAYTGATTVTGGILSLGNSLALQNSALDTTNSIAGNSTAGLKTTVTALTFGGLNGNKDLAALFTTTSGGYGSVTGLTVNPNTGSTATYSGAIANGASGMTLTKSGNGTQVLSGNNTYTGLTTVQNGTLAFTVGNATATGAQSLGANASVTLGVASTSSGILNYTGTGAVTFAKAVNAVGNGQNTVQNSGSGLLTLTGGLSKNGTILVLKGGSNGIAVNGTISGSAANSDLYIDGGTTTLNAANTYNGPTLVYNGGTLARALSSDLEVGERSLGRKTRPLWGLGPGACLGRSREIQGASAA